MTARTDSSGRSLLPAKASLLELLRKPFFVMFIVLVMYCLKAYLKYTIGTSINSPMIAADGIHNIADLFEAIAIIFVIYLAQRKPSQKYPFGRMQIEFVTGLTIGLALLAMAINFALQSIVGILSFLPDLDTLVRASVRLPDHHPLTMDSSTFPWIVAITGGSVLLSLAVSRYQIHVGKRAGHASMVADGQETASDGRIEAVTLVGVLSEYFFHAPWIEYPLGLFVAFLVGRTACELMKGGWRALLLRSIGEEEEAAIKEICTSMPGIAGVPDLKTFRVGHTAVCMITLTTLAEARTLAHLKCGLEHRLQEYFEGEEFKSSEIQIRFVPPDPDRHRVAFALNRSAGGCVIADTLSASTHIVVCDVECGAIVRTKEARKPDDVTAYLMKKQVRALYVFCADKEREIPSGDPSAPEVVESPSYVPSVMGLPDCCN